MVDWLWRAGGKPLVVQKGTVGGVEIFYIELSTLHKEAHMASAHPFLKRSVGGQVNIGVVVAHGVRSPNNDFCCGGEGYGCAGFLDD
jgi:hypothetical protein